MFLKICFFNFGSFVNYSCCTIIDIDVKERKEANKEKVQKTD